MKILGIELSGKRKQKKIFNDYYQNSIEKVGRDQIKRLVKKGLSVPVVML